MLIKIKRFFERIMFNSFQKNAIKCTKKQMAKGNFCIVGYSYLIFLELELPKIFEEQGYNAAVKAAFDKLDNIDTSMDKISKAFDKRILK